MKLGALKDMSQDKNYQFDQEGVNVSYKLEEMLPLFDIEEIKKDTQNLLHMLGHFQAKYNQSIINYLKKEGISEEEIEAAFKRPGSKVEGTIDAFLKLQQETLKELFKDKECKTTHLVLEFPFEIGETAIEEIDFENAFTVAQRIQNGPRTGFWAKLNRSKSLPKTKDLMMIIRPGKDGKLQLQNMIPGPYAPKAPIQYQIENLKNILEMLEKGYEAGKEQSKFYTEVFPNAPWCPAEIKEEVYGYPEVIDTIINEQGEEEYVYNAEKVIKALIQYNEKSLQNNPQNDAAYEFWEKTGFLYDNTRELLLMKDKPAEIERKKETKKKKSKSKSM